jgi:TolB-like protein
MPPADEQLWILGGLALVAAVLGLFVRALMRGAPQPVPAEGPLRLTVRPLKELKPDPNHLYLGATIARELTAVLKRYERLEPVVGEPRSGLAIEGAVRKTGPRVVMTVRLMNGRHAIWRGTYDGAIGELAQIESEIVLNVARTLRVQPRKPGPAREGGEG